MNEFKVNKYIILKLENGISNIYVNGKPFNQCKYIVIRKKVNEIEHLLEMVSIDELAEHYDHSLDGVEPEFIGISPETRFCLHCSNLQVWAENNSLYA